MLPWKLDIHSSVESYKIKSIEEHMEQVVGICWEYITEKKHHAELCLWFVELSFDLLFVVCISCKHFRRLSWATSHVWLVSSPCTPGSPIINHCFPFYWLVNNHRYWLANIDPSHICTVWWSDSWILSFRAVRIEAARPRVHLGHRGHFTLLERFVACHFRTNSRCRICVL